MNRYSYAQNNPVAFTDPSRRCLKDLCVGEGEALYFGAAAAATAVTALAVGVSRVRQDSYFQAKVEALGDTLQERLVPNSYGSRSGPLHRDVIDRRIKELEGQRYEHTGGGILKEDVIRTKGVGKSKRRPHITMRDPATGETYRENVGRTTGSGDPVARERQALDGIEAATGQRPVFTPYDR